MSESYRSLRRRPPLILAIFFLALVVCDDDSNPTPSASPSPIASPTPTPTGSPTATPTATASPTPAPPGVCSSDEYPASNPPLLDEDVNTFHYLRIPACQDESARVEAGGSSDSVYSLCTGAELAVEDDGPDGRQYVRFGSAQSHLQVRITCDYVLEQDLPPGIEPATCRGQTTWRMDYDLMTTGGLVGDPRELWFRARLLTSESHGIDTRTDVDVSASVACSDGPGYTCTKYLTTDGALYGPFFLCNFEMCSGDCTVRLAMNGFARNQGKTTHILVLDMLPEQARCDADFQCRHDDAPPGEICGPSGLCQYGWYLNPCEDPTDCDTEAGYYCLDDGSSGLVGRGLCYDGRADDPCDFDGDCQSGVCADQGGDYGACEAALP